MATGSESGYGRGGSFHTLLSVQARVSIPVPSTVTQGCVSE